MSTPSDGPITPITPEERAKRYEELRRRSMLSAIFAQHRNPDMVVRWVRDDNHDIARHKHLGFVFAKDNPKVPEDKRLIDTVVGISDDGFYRTGDVILMQIDREAYDFYLAENVRRSREMMTSGKSNFKDSARRQHVPTFDREEFFDSKTIEFHK